SAVVARRQELLDGDLALQMSVHGSKDTPNPTSTELRPKRVAGHDVATGMLLGHRDLGNVARTVRSGFRAKRSGRFGSRGCVDGSRFARVERDRRIARFAG